MGKLINRIPDSIKFTRLGFEKAWESLDKPRDSTSGLKALPGKVDIKRHLSPCMRFPTVLYATNKASDQPAHTRSLIRAFASGLSIL